MAKKRSIADRILHPGSPDQDESETEAEESSAGSHEPDPANEAETEAQPVGKKANVSGLRKFDKFKRGI